jgi:nucleoside 2-deoxyribosyltransferase
MKTIYLCGPINGCSDAECKDWRDYVKKHHPSCIDPMRRDYRGRELESVNEIVELDKIDVMNSDVLLVNYDKPSVGTAMEVIYAFERGKFVIVVCKTATAISPWLKYHSHRIMHSFDEALRVIGALD